MNYIPEPGIALVKLIPRFSGIKAPEKKWDSITEGKIISINALDSKSYDRIIGKIGYWEEFKDSVHLEGDYAFIKISDILGTSEE